MNSINRYPFYLIGIIILLLGPVSCDSWRDSAPDMVHTITVTNYTKCDIYVVMDNLEAIHLPEINDSDSFDDVSEGMHTLVAYAVDEDMTKREVDAVDLFVSNRKDYFWEIRKCKSE